MARYGRHIVLRTGSGQTQGGATVDVYEAGGSTPASIYAAVSGGSPVNQVTADVDGVADYYIEVGTGANQYQPGQQFKETYTKGSATETRDYAWTLPFDSTIAQTLEGDLTVAADIYLSGAGTKLQFNDGTSMTTAAVPGSGVTSTGDVSIAADTDDDHVGDLSLASGGTQRLRIAGGADMVELNHDGDGWSKAATLFNLRGFRHGFAPRYKDADEIYIGAGVVEIDGTACHLDTETGFDMDAALGTAFGNNYWYVFGFHKPSSGNSLTSSELVCAQIMPTWNESRNGWYLPAPHSGGTPISSSDEASHPKTYAFVTGWIAWASGATGAAVSGSAYIGYDCGSGNTCAPTAVLIAQSTNADTAISSAKLQYSDNVVDWYDHETIAITDPNASLRGEYITLSSPGSAHRAWRLLANDSPAAGNSWYVFYLHFIDAGTDWVRVINRFRTNGSAQVDAVSLWAGDKYTHSPITILSDTTPAYAAIEYISADTAAWGAPTRCGGYGSVQDDVTDSTMQIASGSGSVEAIARTQAANQAIETTWDLSTNASGQIGHQGQNLTYSIYAIVKFWDFLPSGM